MQIFELAQKQQSTLLIESVCHDLTRDQRRIVEGIVRELRPLFETTLTPDQIQQIFQQAQQKQTAQGGAGRTVIGKTVDATKAVAGTVNKAIDGLGRFLQDTRLVQKFDQKFENLKTNITAKYGADNAVIKTINQLGQYARNNPGKTAFVIGTLTAVAALATGPGGAAIAGQVLRAATELLKGEKLSTAVGKGLKTAAFGYLTGSVLDSIGDWFRTWTLDMVQYTTEIRKAKFGWSETINFSAEDIARVNRINNMPGVELISASKGEAEQLAGYFRNADADRLSQLVKTFNTTGNPTAKIQAWDEFRKIFAKCTEPGYFEGGIVDDNTARQLAIANDKLYQTTVKLTKGITAAAQGIVQAATGATKAAPAPAAAPPAVAPAAPAVAPAAPAAAAPAAVGTATNQVRERYTRLTNKEIREIFAIAGGQLTEGPVLDKLKSFGTRLTTKQVDTANLYRSWEKSGKPDDSGIIADILKAGNVTDDVIQDIYTAMNIEVATPAGRYRPPAAAATAGAATGTGTAGAATGTTQDQGANVFGNMTQTMKTMQPPGATSTGGSVAQTPTGLRHTAKTAGNTAQSGAEPADSAAGIGQKFTKAKQTPISSAPGASDLSSMTPPQLISKLQKTLSPEAFNELATLMLKSKMSGMNKPK